MSKQQQNDTYSVSQFSRFTRVMALFTASLFLVSSNLALPAQASALDQAVRGEMTRQEWRQFRQENRAAGMPSRGLPNPVFTTQPITVPNPDTSVTIISAPTTGGTININGSSLGGTFNASSIQPTTVTTGNVNVTSSINTVTGLKAIGGGLTAAERAARKEARADRRAERIQQREDRRATQGVATPQPVSVTRVRESREDRTARIQEHKAEKLSRFVIQENAGALIKLDNGANLDLTASSANITLGDKLFADGGFVTIEVGGEKKNVYAGSKVTAAEYVAVKQVLGGKQEIVINGSGVATGGTVDLNNLAATRNNMKASGLTVASGVTAIGDLAKDSSFRINGDLNNFGSVYAVASEKGRHSGDISAVNITNNEGALISSAGGSKVGNKADAIDLSLNADQNFSNFGTITSSGDLNVTAGGAIKNTGNATAKNNLSFNSADITNSGTVASTKGDITVDSPVGTVMNVNNAGGKLQALNGSINVRAPGNVDGLDSNVTGGDLLSKTLELNAGQGLVDVNVNALTGTVNGSGTGAHVAAVTDNLNIGDVCLTGDPTIKNAAGNINFTGDFTAGEALAVLASGNITATSGANVTVTARTAGNVGQPIVFAAGYGLTGVSTDTTTIPGGVTNATNPITASSAVATGGSIDFSLANSFNITASGTAIGASGGNVSLFANRQGGVGGDILLPTNSTIDTRSGTTAGLASSGNVTIVGAGNIAIGSITADRNNSQNGNILVRNVNPTGSTTFATNGTISSGGFSTAGPATTGTITINNGATISGRNTVTIDSASTITGAGNGAHNITSTNGSVSVTGTSLTSSGGAFNIAANSGNNTINVGAGNSITTGGGAFTASASGNVNLTAASINTTGAGAGGAVNIEADSDDSGNGNLNANGVAVNTTGTAGGAGGAINLDSGDNAGQVLQIGSLQSQGNGAGAGGNITFGALSGDAGNMTVGSMNAGTGTINIDANNANHTLALGGNIDASSLTIDVGNGGTITSGGITITTDGYTVNTGSFNAGANTLTITTQTAGTTIGLNGGIGTLNISAGELADFIASSINIGTGGVGGSGTLTTANTLNISGVAGTDAGAYSLNLNSNDAIAGSGNFTIGANSFAATATNSVALGNISGGTGGSTIQVTSNTNSVTVGNLGNATGFIDLNAGTTIQTGSVVKTGGGAFTADGTGFLALGAISTGAAATDISATTGNVTTQAIATTTGLIDLDSGSGSVLTGAIQTADGAIDVDAGTNITVNLVNVSGTGTVDLNAGTSVGITNNITGSAAGVTLTANNGNVTSGSISANGTTGAVDINSTNGLINVGAVTGASFDADATGLIGTGSINVSGGVGSGFVTLTSLTSSVDTAGGITATGLVDVDAATTVNIGLVSGDITTAGAVDLTGNTGVTTRNIGGPASSITINSTSGAISTGTLTATGLIDVGGNTTTGVTTGAISTGGNVDLDASNTAVIQTGTIGAGTGNINVDSGSNNLGALTNTGTIAVNAATTSTIAGINNAAGTPGVENVGITSGTTTNITGAINGGTGDIRLQGTTGDVNFTSANLTTGNLIIIAGNNTTGNSITTTTGNIDITSTAGNTNITGAVAQAGGTMDITSGGTTNVGSYTNTTGDIIINSANTVTIGTTILTGAGSDIIIHSGQNIITTGTLQADPIQLTAVGFISLGGSLIADDGISAVAGQDIFNTAAISINANGATDGGNVTLVSGADFSVAGTDVTINGASVSGGSIDFVTTAGFGNITSTGTAGTGGDVTLVAYSNGFNGGSVLLPTTSGIVTTGSGANASGRVTVAAGAISGQAIQIGSITQSTATNGAAGSLTSIGAATPAAGQVINLSAAYTGSFITNNLTAADIRIGNITNRAGTVLVAGAGNVGLGTVNVSGRTTEPGGTINITAQGSDVFDIGIAAGQNFAQGLIANGGSTSGDGGIIAVTNLGSTGIRTQSAFSITTNNGAGGTINLNADQGTISLANGSYSTNGAGANNGGDITLNGAGVLVTGGGSAALVSNGAGGGNGGNINITGTGTPGLTLGTGAGQLTVSVAGGTNGVVNMNVGGNLTVSATGGYSAASTQLMTTGAGSDITINGAITTTLSTVIMANDAVAINSTINAGNSALVQGGGTINGSGAVNGTLVSLTSTGGNIGNSSASRLNVNATNLVANAQAGSAFINDTAGGVAISANSSAANTFDLQANGAVSNSVGATVTANDVVLRSTGSTVTLNDVVTGTTTATIRGNGAITTAGVGQVNGGTVNLTSDTASIGTSSASRFNVDATNLVANATAGSAFLRDANTVNIGPGASVVGATYDLTAVGDIQSSGSVTAQDVLLNSGASFFLNSTIIGNNSIALRSANSITNTNLGGATLTTPTLALRSVNGNIGSSSLSRLNIDANNLTAVAANGSVWIADANDVNLVSASGSNGDFDIVAGGNLSTDAASTIQSFNGSVLLRATTGSINTAGAITANTAGQSVTLRAGQSLLNGQVGGTFTTPTLNLISDNGNIGASAASRFDIGLGVANVTANAAAGSVFLTTASTVNLGAGSSSALNTFDVVATGAATDLTTSGAISAATINLTAGQNLTTNAAVTATGDVALTAQQNIATNAAVSGNNVAYVAVSGGVTLGGSTTGTSSITVTSNNSILNANIAGGLNAPQITLVTNNSVGVNAGTRLDLNATNLTVQAGVSAFINDTAGGVNLSGTNTAGTAFNLTANGDITNSGTITTGTGNIALSATGAGSDIIVGNLISSGNNLNFQATGTGGTIAVNANVTAAAQITMSADSNLTTGVGATVINNGLIVLNSNNGNIGTSAASRFVIDANNVQATAPNGNVWISDIDAVNVGNGASIAGQTFDLVANGNLGVNGGASVSANNVVLRAAGAGSTLSINGAVNGTTSATLRADGNIVNATGVGNVTAPQLNLISDSGSIGVGPANRLNIDATNLTANAATDVFINDTAGGVNIGAASSAATGAFNVLATGGALTTSGAISGNNVVLTGDTGVTIGAAVNAANNATLASNANNVVINGVVTAGNNVNVTGANAVNVNAAVNGTNVNLVANGAAVNVNATVTGSNSITVDSVNSITNGTLGGNLVAPTISLISDNSIGAAGNRLNITATNLSLTAGNNAFVNAAGSVNLLASSAVNTLDVAAVNNLTTSGAVNADNVVLRATNGSLTLGALVNGTTSVSLRSFNSITNLNAPTAFVTTGAGGTVNLTSDNGDIGVGPTSRFVIDADNLTANAANGSVYIHDTDSVNLGAGSSSAANNFDLTAAQDISNSGTVSANNVSLRAIAGTLTLGALINGTTSVSLRSGGDITDAAVVNVVSDQINLTSDNGNIGTNVNPLNIDALNLTANAFNGNVFINDANNVTIGGGTSNALNTFSVTAGSNLSTTGTITAADVVLTASTGSLFINALITGGNSISLTQALTMTNANIGAPLVSPQINLTSTGGSIGTGTFNRLVLDAASISFNAAGSVFFQDPNTVNVSGATAGGTIDILANNDLSTSGLVTGNTIVLTSTLGDVNLGGATVSTTTVNVNAGDDINVNSPVFGTVLGFNATGDINFNANVVGTTSLTAVAGDNIAFNSAGGAPVVNFTATNGNVTIDASLIATTSLTINAGNQIDWNAGGGSQVVNFTTTNGDVNINALLVGTTSVSVNAGDDINTSAPTQSPIVNFTAADDINLNGNINAPTSATLVAGGTITQGVGNIITGGGALSLQFTEGPVTLTTNVSSLTTNAAGQTLTINENNGINILSQNLDNLTVNSGLVGGGPLNVQVALNLVTLTLNNNNGNINLNASTTTSGDTSLTASGTINQNAGIVTADQLNLLWGTGNVTLATEVNSLNANGGTNSLTINEATSIDIVNLLVGAATINANGNITTSASFPDVISAVTGNLALNAAGDITLGSDVSAINTVFLNAGGTITQTTGSVNANLLDLTWVTGAVVLNTDALNLNASAPGQDLTINNAGGINILNIDLNSLTVNAGLTATGNIVVVNPLTVPGPLVLNNSDGDIVLNAGITSLSAELTASGTLTQTAGVIETGSLILTWGTGAVTLDTSVDYLVATSPGNSLTINQTGDIVLGGIDLTTLTVTAASDIETSVDFTVTNLNLTATGGSINLNSNVNVTNVANLVADNTITQGAANVFGGEGTLNLTWQTGDVTLTTAVDTVNATGSVGGALTINEQTGITIGNISNIADLTVNAGQVTAGDIDVAQALNLDTLALSTDGNIGMNVNIAAGTSASFLASGDILQTGGTITTPDLTVGYIGLTGGTVTISDTTNNGADQSITVLGLKDVSITTNETGIVTLQASTANSLNIDAADSSQFVFGGDSAALTSLSVNATEVLNEHLQSAQTITIQSLVGDLTVSGGTGGTWQAFSGGTNFSAADNLNLDGIQDILGNATFTSGNGFAINVLATADVEATGSITLNTCNLNLAGILIGNPIYFNCPLGAGTIANSNGDVLLTSDLIFTGLDLAIIASGSIIENGITVIDLSNAGGDGGSLTLLAGFDFTPATMGQVGPNNVLYTITGTSVTGGSIQLGTTNITTASTGILGDGGNVFAAASGGSVELNNVDTSAALGAGGNVTVTGENGITVNGNINSSAIGSGNVSLAVGTSVVNGQVLIGNGEMFGSGSIDFGAPTAGNILVSGNLNAGDASATLLGALNAGETISVNGTLTADTLNVNAGDGNTTAVTSNVLNLNSTSNGTVELQSNTGDLAIGAVSGLNQNLIVNNDGTIDVNSAMSIGSLNLTQNNIGAEGISINAPVTTLTDITLTNEGTNAITVGGALNAGGNITIAQNGGGGADVLINASLTTTGGNIDIDSADVISTLAGTSLNSAGTLDLFAVGSVLIGGAGAVSSGSDMSIVSIVGDVVFGTNPVTSGGTTTISGNNVTTGGDVISSGVMNITATTGEVVLNDALSGLSDINVLAATNVVFNPGINAIGTLGNVSVEATTGSIFLNGVDTQIDGFDVILTAGTDISAAGAQSLSVNALNNLTINAPIDLTGGLVLTGESVTANGNISADAGISIGVKSNPFTTNGDITSLGDIYITTNVLENTNAITGTNVYIQSFAGSGVTVDGTAGPGGLITATGVIEVTGTGGDATFLGEQTFDAPDTAFTSATNFAVVIGLGADVTVTGTLDLNTCNLVLLGSLTAPIINFNCPLGAGTIANSIGNVDLTGVGALNFSGLDLAILAQGNVLAGTNTSINLSSSTGDGGDLLVVAGFDFTPATGGQVNFSPTLFTITGTSTSGGNIDFTGLTINTGSTFAGGNGGSVTLVANGGLTNAGTITTEAITTTGDNNGGAVTIIGEGDIHLNGTVNTTGTNGTGGDVTLAVAQAFLAPGPSTQVGNGELLQGGFAVGAASLGELLAGTINAGNGNVAITSSSGGFDTTSIADLIANSVSFTVGDGSAIVDTSAISNLNVTSYGSGSGYVELTDNHASITLTSNAGSNDVSVSITNNANIAVGAGAHTYGLLDLNGSLVTVNGDIDASSNVTANGAAGVAVNGSIMSDATVSLAATIMGNVVISGPVTGASVNLATNSSFGNIFIDGVVTANAIGGAITITTNGGGVSQTANVDADILNLNLTNGGTVTLANANNSVDLLNVDAAGTASVTFNNNGALSLNVIQANAAQDLDVTASGTLDLISAITANNVTLNGGGAGLVIDGTINATNATLTATAGDLTISSTVTATGNATLASDLGDVNVNAAVSGDVTDISTSIGSGGSIFVDADVTGSTSVSLVSDGGLTQTSGTIFGGDLSVAFTTGAAVLTTDVDSLDSLVTGTSLTVNEATGITLGANLGNNLTVNTTNGSIDTTVPLSFANLNLNAGGVGSDLNLGADVTGSTTIILTANDAIVPTVGTVINGGALTLNFGNLGPTLLGTNVASLTTNNAGGDLTIVNQGAIVLNGQDLAALTVSTLNGDITTAAALTGLTTLSLEAGGSNDINLNGGAVSATTMYLTATGGDVVQNGTSPITATTLNLNVDGTADLDQTANNVGTLNASGAGNVFLDNGANALVIGTVGPAQSLFLTNGAGGMTIGADLTTTGDIVLNTNSLSNTGFAVSANLINVTSEAGQGLVVNGGAGINVAQYGATNGVFFNATLDNLVLNGNTTFTSIAELSALNGTDMIIVSTGANVIGQQQLTVNTCNLILQGILVGNPLVWNNPCGNGTIANSTGDVNLLGDIIYNGQDLAILASGSINAAGATVINLTNSSGNGGNLTLMAGYDFTPATPGQVTNGNVEYTISGYSTSGGNINLGGLDVITNGSAGSNGGNVVAVANGGSGAAGDITIGDITSNGVNGGNLQVIAEGAIDLGAVNLNGTTAGGNANITTAIPSSGVGITVENGVVTGTFTAGANLGGSLEFDSITTNNGGDVTLVANLNTGTAGTVTGDVVTLTSSSDIGVDAANRFTVNANTVTGTAVGDAFIRNTNTAASTLGAITVATGGTIDAYFTGDLATGAKTAGVIELRTDGAFNVTGVLNGSTSIGLTSGTDLTNTQVAAANLVTPLLTLRTSNNADIGSTGTAFQVGAGTGEIRIDTATNGGDSAYVTSLATGGVNLGASIATNDLFFSANGPLTVIGNVTNVDGNINITAGSGAMRINNGVTIQANSPGSNGNVFIGNAINGGSKQGTSITFGDGAQIIGNAAVKPGGNVTIQMGELTSRVRNLTNPPRNVTYNAINGGVIQGGKSAKPFYAGRNGDPANTITADNATVFISNTLKNKNIILEGNVLIQADPPSVAGEAATTNAYLPNGGSFETVANKANAGLTTNTASSKEATFADTMLNTMFNSNAGVMANTAIGTDLNATATAAGVGNGAGSTVTAADTTLVGGVATTGEDNSYMVGGYGPTAQADASICSDVELGVSGNEVAKTAHSNRVVLKKGNVLFVPFQDTVVETPHGNVTIEAKSVALVSISNDKLAVYDIEDSHKGSVSVNAHGQTITLAPGNHVTVAHATSGEFAQVNAIEAIPHRNVATKTIKAGVKAHTSEFSVASAISSIKPLQLVLSSKHPQAKQVANKMMKTTAILLHMGGKGEFQHYFKPAMTAMAK